MSQASWIRAVLPAVRRREMTEACKQRLPYETCGVLLGKFQGKSLFVEDYRVIRNISRFPEDSFAFDPEDWVRVYYDADRKGTGIVGIFHSHPDGTVRPSLADSRGHLPWGTYWIVGMAQGECSIAAYQPCADGGWMPIRIHEPDESGS